MMRVGMQHMVSTLSACRADIGFVTPKDRLYRPAQVFYNRSTEPPSCDGVSYSTQVAAFQKAWRQRKPVSCENIRSDPLFADSRQQFGVIETKSILFQRLTLDGRPVGMTCIDYTREAHAWTPRETDFVHSFCSVLLGPLIGISQYWNHPARTHPLKRPSEAELAAIRLAAQGLSYKQIADQLGKSVRTIENQLRNARLVLDAANQAELITRCEIWL